MAAIDLLLQIKPKSERVHQLVLATLLANSRLAQHLGIEDLPKAILDRDSDDPFVWEAEGRLFDLQIPLTRGSLYVEVKTDSDLGDEQLARQADRIAELGKNEEGQADLLYVVLGARRFLTSGERIRERLHSLGKNVERTKYADTGRVIEALKQLLSDPPKHPADYDVRDLAAAYLTALAAIESEALRYPAVPAEQWDQEHYFAFYRDLKANVPSAADADFEYVPNPAGGFFGCWWCWRPLGEEARAYIQFEFTQDNPKVVIKVEVDASESQSQVRDAFSATVVETGGRLGVRAERPGRFGKGNYMTVAVLPSEFDVRMMRTPAEMDWKRIREACTTLQRLLDAAVEAHLRG